MEEIYINIELLALIILAILILGIKNRTFNLKLIKIVFIVILLINPLQLFFNSASSTPLTDIALIVFSEVILMQNLISIIIKPNHNPVFQNSLVMITTCLIGIIFAVNFLIITGWLAGLLLFILMNYFASGEPKVFKEYIPIIISFTVGIIAFFIFSLFLTILTGGNVLLNGEKVGFEIYVIILLFTIGTFGGIFPFNLLLNKFFKDSNFQTLNIYMIVQYSLLFFLIRSIFLNITLILQFGLVFLIVGIIGLSILIYNIYNELFFNYGRKPVSLRNLLGTLFILDFNCVILLTSLLFFSEVPLILTFLNYIFFTFLAKFVIMVPLQYKMKKLNSNNLNKLGNIFYEKRFLGVFASLSGFITAFPSSFLSFFIILNSLLSQAIQSSVVLFSMVIMIMIAQVFYVITTIVGITSISIKINFNKGNVKID